MKFKSSLILFLCAIITPCLVHAQKASSKSCTVVGAKPICAFDGAFCPSAPVIECSGSAGSEIITFDNNDDVTSGKTVTQSSGNVTAVNEDIISVGVTDKENPNMNTFDEWGFPSTFEVTATGTYNLTGGTLTAGFETVNGIMNQSGTSMNTLQSNPNGAAVHIHCTGAGANDCTTIVYSEGSVGALDVIGTDAKYNLMSGTLNAPVLLLNTGGTFTQTGGTATIIEGQVEDQTITTQLDSGLYVGYSSVGTYNLTAGALQVGGATKIDGNSELFPGYEYIGYNKGSNGTFNQSGGTNNVGAVGEIPGYLYLGYNGTGTYNLSGGSFGGTYPTYEYIGYNPGSVGSFVQTGGHNGEISKADGPSILTLYLGYAGTGNYTLGKTGGTTTSAYVSAYDEYIGNHVYESSTGSYVNGIGTFTQNAGTNQVGLLDVGDQGGVGKNPTGTYNLVGGSITSYTTGQGSSENVGLDGYGVFNQSGGSNYAVDLEVGSGGTGFPASGIYNLSGGTLTVCCSDELLGEGPDSNGVFNQSGGTNTNLELVIGLSGGNGKYNLSKGTLKAGNLVLGEDSSGGSTGAFVQTGGTVDTIFTLTNNGIKYTETGTVYVGETGTGSYDLSAGTLSAGTEYIGEGVNSVGTFTQATGSTNSIATNETLFVGYYGQGTYTMNGGTLKAYAEVIGTGLSGDTTVNTFTQKTGANTISSNTANGGDLQIGESATGIYDLDGGALTAASLAIGTTGSMVADKAGTAALTFKISGTTTNDGKMSFTDTSASLGAFTNDGSLTLNATTTTAGKLTLGTYAQGSAGILKVSLDGKTAGTNYYALDIFGAATLGGTLDLTTGFTPVVGDVWDILNYASETGSFKTINLPTAPTGDHYVFNCGAKDCTLTLDSGGAVASATQGAVIASPEKRVSRGFAAAASSASTQQPVAILSRIPCFTARLLGSGSCDGGSAAAVSHSGEMHAVPSSGIELSSAHNNVMVSIRSISSGRGGASHETSASASRMARLYVCAYFPSSVGHTMGCN
jgi:hypothetical protein